MADTEREIFHEYYGPFPETHYAIFTVVGSSYNLAFDVGPEINVAVITSESTTVFKFPPNSVFELSVSVVFGRFFKFQGAQLTGVAAKTTQVSARPQLAAPGKVCGSLFCDESIPCDDPETPAMSCIGGLPKCVSGENE